MTPCFSMNNQHGICKTYIVLFCKESNLGPTCSFFSYFKDVFVSQFRKITFRPHYANMRFYKTEFSRMSHVFFLSNIFKIGSVIIKLNSIFMVHLKSYWFFANKCSRDNCVDKKRVPFQFSINPFIKSNACIYFFSFLGNCRDSWRKNFSCFNSADFSFGRYFIYIFKIIDRHPNFMCHKFIIAMITISSMSVTK